MRHKGHVALIGDGQVTMGQSIVMKHTAKKVRRMYKDQIVAGFAGATADACAHLLLRAGAASVCVLTLARTHHAWHG